MFHKNWPNIGLILKSNECEGGNANKLPILAKDCQYWANKQYFTNVVNILAQYFVLLG